MRRIPNLVLTGLILAGSSMFADNAWALDGTIAQNSAWNVTRTGAEDTLRIVAYGDSIKAGYVDFNTIAQRASTHVAAEYGAALWGQNIQVRRRAQSGAVAQGIYNRIVSATDRAFMQTSNTIGVSIAMCGNDYLQARSAFAGQTGICNYSGLETALDNCLHFTEAALDYVNDNAGANAKLKIVGNLYYPGFNSDNVTTNCTDPDTGETFNRRDRFLPIIAESNWATCNLADQYGWVCADNFAEFMAADYDSNGDGMIDNQAIRYISGESKEDYIARILAAYQAGLLTDSNFKEIGPSSTVGYLLSDNTHTTYIGPTGKAGLTGGTPGGNVAVFHNTSGAYPDGKNPTWDLNGHDRMGQALATSYDLDVDAGPDVTILECETYESFVSFNDRVFWGPWDIWVDYGDGNGAQAEIAEMSFDLFNEYSAGGSYTVDVVVTGAYGTLWEDAATVTVLTAEEAVQELIEALDALWVAGEIPRGWWIGNRRPLENALSMLGNGMINPAQSMIQDFIDGVQGTPFEPATKDYFLDFGLRTYDAVTCNPNPPGEPPFGIGPRPSLDIAPQGHINEEHWIEFDGVHYHPDDPVLHQLMLEAAEQNLDGLD